MRFPARSLSRIAVLALSILLLAAAVVGYRGPAISAAPAAKGAVLPPIKRSAIEFSLRSVRNGNWSSPATWEPQRVPAAGERVLISRGTKVAYDVDSPAVLRLVQVSGRLAFARDRNTQLNVGMLKVQNSDACSEDGFACDLHDVTDHGEPFAAPAGPLPVLEVGSLSSPIPAQFTARIRLHYLEGMNKDNAPALACCAGRMELHGAPLSRTWVKLGGDLKAGETQVALAEVVTGWKVGDEVIVTGSKHHDHSEFDFRREHDQLETEQRTIQRIEGQTITLDKPLKFTHQGSGDYRSEIANLSRNVIVESADPSGVRGHTVYHQFSRGGISYARFAHLGKENTLGRYAIHFHLAGESMRGSSVLGAAIVDSHNRWVTVHGTNYLVVRDCVGFGSVGHGFFMEDGTEEYNVLDRNLGVQAYRGKTLPKQVLPFDPNEGAAFWWANGRNALVRNVSCENFEYGYRFDSQKTSNFDSRLEVLAPDGARTQVDIRTIPIWRFDGNESHSEGLYSFVFAGVERAAPDTRHPHVLRNLTCWDTHYALRTQLPCMLVENVKIERAIYGVYRPEYENHVYRNLLISRTDSEPFNRGLDDDSKQNGSITVDQLTFQDMYQGDGIPLIQMSDNNPSGKAETHIRNLKVISSKEPQRRAIVNRGGGSVVPPTTDTSVPVFVHDYFGPGRTAKIVSTAAKNFAQLSTQEKYREERPLTGRESRVTETGNVPFPQLLDPVDDLPPATSIQFPTSDDPIKVASDGILVVRGTTTDNTATTKVLVNGVAATSLGLDFHQWEARLSGVKPGPLEITALGEDAAGNRERMPHKITVQIEN